jgi:LmbE family N-acetylglucosaminyl deacetylase
MTTLDYYHSIYIAPHLDDAVLSCGGQIYEETGNGHTVLVVTVMAGDPPAKISNYATQHHIRWGLSDNVVARRRQEDIAACDRLGAVALHWDVPDCIYRADPQTGRALYSSEPALFGPVQDADMYLVDIITSRLASLPAAGRIVIPLTVGNHVDHQIVRQAAERCFCDQWQKLEYYEDFPYVQAPASLDFLDTDHWYTTIYSIGSDAIYAKIEAILLYRSQLSTFFSDRADLKRQIDDYVTTVGGERTWNLKKPPG